MLETSIWFVPTPVVPNGSNAVRFVNWGVYSRPRRTSPKPPPRLTVERRLNARPPPPLELAWLLVAVAVPVPSSLFTPASIQNEADRPPPISSPPPLDLVGLWVPGAGPVPSSLSPPASIETGEDGPPPMSSVPRNPGRLPP